MGNVIPCFVLKWENLFPIEIGPNRDLLIPIITETKSKNTYVIINWKRPRTVGKP